MSRLTERPIMRKRLLLLIVLLLPLAGALGVACYRSKPKPIGPMYRGMTAAEWEGELERWTKVDGGVLRRPPAWRVCLAKLRLPVSVEPEPIDEELFDAMSNPADDAVSVLIELLNSREVQVRRIAAEVLNTIAAFDAESTQLVVPALLAAMKDTDEIVRNNARWVGSSRVDLQACKLEYSIVSPK